MFPAQGTVVFQDQIRRAVDEGQIFIDALAGEQIEIDPAMDAALAEMAVQGGVVVKLVHQLAELPQIVAYLVRDRPRRPPSRAR